MTLFSAITTGDVCVRSCAEKVDGKYQSCTTCEKYVNCTSKALTEVACPANMKWDNDKTACANTTATCELKTSGSSSGSSRITFTGMGFKICTELHSNTIHWPKEVPCLTQCRVNVGPTSKTAGKHWPSIGSVYCLLGWPGSMGYIMKRCQWGGGRGKNVQIIYFTSYLQICVSYTLPQAKCLFHFLRDFFDPNFTSQI